MICIQVIYSHRALKVGKLAFLRQDEDHRELIVSVIELGAELAHPRSIRRTPST